MEHLIQYLNEAMPQYIVPVFNSGLAVLGGLIVYAIFCRALKKIAARGYLDLQLRIVLCRIVRWIAIIVVVLLSLGFFGVSVGTLWAALSGVLALVALGFVAVWSVLSNVLCSILLIVFPPFRIGDEIEIMEPTANFSVRGKVVSTNMLFTSLEVSNEEDGTVVDSIVRIPNNIFFQKYVRRIPGKHTESLQKFTARQQEQ